jgi:hypothetical protein
MFWWIGLGVGAWFAVALGAGTLIGRVLAFGSGSWIELEPVAATVSAGYDRRRGPTAPLPLAWERRAEALPKPVAERERRSA